MIRYSKKQSFFLFGPRSTGKTTFLKSIFAGPSVLWLDLLDLKSEKALRLDPSSIKTLIKERHKTVVIDEIQRNPDLLDVVHQLSLETKVQFILTGSSARKLKRGQANLLAGRAFNYYCFPLTYKEMSDQFELNDVLSFGSLPKIFSLETEEKKDYLRSYIDVYFKEEVVAEQLVRNLRPFRNFLDVASQSNGKIINYSNIAKDIDVDPVTVQKYFEILEDTLVGFLLHPFHESVRKRQRAKSKFYYFDTGVQRALSGKLDVPLIEATFDFGDSFEHFIVLEIKKIIHYQKPDWKMSYLRTSDDAEIDLILERPGQKTLLIEIKSTTNVSLLEPQKMLGYKSLIKAFKNSRAVLLSRDPIEAEKENILFFHWEKFLSDAIFEQ